MIYSRHFNQRQLRGLLKVGGILIPGGQGMQSFSESQVVNEVDRVADFMSAEDRSGFIGLMEVFFWLPSPLIRSLLSVSIRFNRWPGSLGSAFRLIEFGVKGVVQTLYYSGSDADKKVLPAIGYDAAIRSAIVNTRESDLGAVSVFEHARAAAETVAMLSLKERLVFISRLRSVLLDRQEECVDSVQKATGKCRSDALISEIFPILDFFYYLETNTLRALKSQKISTPISLFGKRSVIHFEPLGVVLVISPWNYPLFQALVPIVSAFVAGNSVVYKPSEVTPMKGLVEGLLGAAGFNSFWVQVVYGDGNTGRELIEQRPQKIFFTGSVATGKKIMAQAAQYLIPVELELGGKDPMLVFADATISRAAKGAVWGAFTNSGQSCTSVERVLVQQPIYEDFKRQLLAEISLLKVAPDTDGDADLGRMISAEQAKKVYDLLGDARAKGARVLSGVEWDGVSLWIPPIVLEGVSAGMKMMEEEIFGPILPIFPFEQESDAVRMANDSSFGLSASVWTRDRKRAERVTRALQTGNVSVNNVMLTEGNPALPFGGVKESGIGRYKGALGLQAFCSVKSVLYDADSKKIEANWYPYTARKYVLFSKLITALFGHKGLRKWIGFAAWGLLLEHEASKAKRKTKA